VRKGELCFLNKGSSSHIRTADDYQDFQLRLDFQIDRSGNSGLFLRSARNGKDPAYTGCELQILDDFNFEADKNTKLNPYQFTAGLYGSKAPDTKDALKPLGEWNTYDVYYRGSRMTVRLNGKQIHDIDTHKIDGNPPFKDRVQTGFIGMQRHGAGRSEGDNYARFRNIFIRPLD